MAHPITVKMFGNFRMELDGTPLVTEKMHRESQFNRLMQMMMHYSKTGIAKEKLEEYVIGEKEMGAPHTALRVIVYRARQKLEQLGIPVKDCIYLEKGVYYWTKEIEVVEDAELFQNYYDRAKELKKEKDKSGIEKRLGIVLDACYTYTGEFLSAYISEPWAFQEAKKYRQMFGECVMNAAELLRQTKSWGEMEKLGRFASQVDPLQEWEVLVMEALVESVQLDKASCYYSEVTDYYLKECGVYPSDRMMETLNKYIKQMDHTVEIFEDIKEKIKEDDGEIRKGYECSFPVFKGIYQQEVRMTERTDRPAYLILCTLVDEEGKQFGNEEELKKLSENLRDSISRSIRKSDVYTQYGKLQYLILLANYEGDNCKLVQDSINSNFMATCKNGKVKYRVNSVKFEM